jgi:hypothetical protein
MDVFVFLLVLMARLAGERLMWADQLESGLAVPLGHVGHEPRLGSMAALAGVSQLVAVNVSVTVGAFGACCVIHEGSVTLPARDLCVLPVQGEPGERVVEL